MILKIAAMACAAITMSACAKMDLSAAMAPATPELGAERVALEAAAQSFQVTSKERRWGVSADEPSGMRSMARILRVAS